MVPRPAGVVDIQELEIWRGLPRFSGTIAVPGRLIGWSRSIRRAKLGQQVCWDKQSLTIRRLNGVRRKGAPVREESVMAADKTYQVRWLLAPEDPDGAGLFGTTTHAAKSPASAAVRSAESVALAIAEEDGRAAFHVISVTDLDSGDNLLSSEQLRAALRYHPTELPVEVVYRPLC